MNYHILIILLFIVFLINKKTIEGNTNSLRLTINNSSRLSEIIDQTEYKIQSLIQFPREDIHDYVKESVLKAEYIASQSNELNTNLIANNQNWNNEILELMSSFSDEYDEVRIGDYQGNKDDFRNEINEKKEIDIENYGYRHEIVTKRFLDKKYRELKENYEELLDSNQCEEQINTAINNEEKKCDVSINKKQDIIDKKIKEIKKLEIRLARNSRIKKNLKKTRIRLKKLNKKNTKWNAVPRGVIFKNKFPRKEFNNTKLGCKNSLRIKSKNSEKCNEMCKKDKKCKYVWQYKNTDRCCFKDGYNPKYGFRFMPTYRAHGWYTKA